MRIYFWILAGLSALPFAAFRAQPADPASAMHWRQIGPTRAGRARAVSGVASQPNVSYIGFDNGGVWRSTDYGSNWEPIFDRETTGSIGAIAVAPSDPNVIYVGTGAGIIRPDLATGDGVYKSTDAGKTWTHLGLVDSQMIAMIDVSPRDPNRVFVAVLGHPYAPSAERGVFRSTDGGKTFEKVLYRDEYTSADDVRIDPNNPDIVYAALWQQQQSYIEGGAFGGSGGIFKSTDGGTTWHPLTDGLPEVLQANLAVSPSNPKIVYAMIAAVAPAAGAGQGGRRWPGGGRGASRRVPCNRSLQVDRRRRPLVSRRARSGRQGHASAGPQAARANRRRRSDDRHRGSERIRTSSTSARRCCGAPRTEASHGRPCGARPAATTIRRRGSTRTTRTFSSWSRIRAASSRRIAARAGARWYTQPTAAMYHVSTDHAFPYRVCGGQQDSGSACVDSRSNDGEITFHDWHPVNIQEYGEAAPDPKNPDLVYGSARTGVSLYNRKTGQTTQVGPTLTDAAAGVAFNRNVRTMPIEWSPVNPSLLFYASNAVWKTIDGGTQLDAHQRRPHAPDVDAAGEHGEVCEQRHPRSAGLHHGAFAVGRRT